MTWKSTEITFGKYKKYWQKNQGQGAHTLSTSVGGTPTPWARPLPRGPLTLHQPQLQLHIFTFGEKKIKEKDSSRFTIWSRRQALFFLGRADLESVRGSREGDSSPSSSPISWCSPLCVSNSIVGLLDGDGLDEIYHVIKLVLLGFDP